MEKKIKVASKPPAKTVAINGTKITPEITKLLGELLKEPKSTTSKSRQIRRKLRELGHFISKESKKQKAENKGQTK